MLSSTRRIQCTGLLAAAMLLSASAEDTVVVSAERVPTASEDVVGSVSIITEAELIRFQRRDVPSALAVLPGVHVVRAGGIGQAATLYMRGAKPDGLLVLIDGIEMNDPSLIGRNADLSLLDVTQIERIEVLRGPQSALYGADGMGGVINIITKRGAGKPSGFAEFEAGSYNTFRETLGFSGGQDWIDYAVSVMRLDSEGISAANEKDGNKEKDGVERTAVVARLGLRPTDALSVDLVARYSQDRVDYDNGAGPGADSPDNVADGERFFLGTSASLLLLDEVWQQRLGLSMTSHKRDFISDWGRNWFDGQHTRISWQHDLYPADFTVLSVGAEYEREKAETDALASVDSEMRSLFVQDRLLLGERVILVGGARLDDHDRFGEEITWRAGATVKVAETGTRLRGSAGTGFKAPSLYQLYAPASEWGPIGNPALDPETSLGWDVGVEQTLCGGAVQAGLTYFDSEYDDLIDFVAGYVNQSAATARGVEATLGAQLSEALSVRLNYTYTDSEDGEGATLSRRPRHRAVARVDYRMAGVFDLGLEAMHVGRREDAYFDVAAFETVEKTLPSHTLFNLAGTYHLKETMSVFGRIENLLDKDYEELAGYGTPGFSVYGGVRVSI